MKGPLVGIAALAALGMTVVAHAADNFPSKPIRILVGYTAAMVVLGYDATTPVGMEEMLTMAGAVRRGLEHPLLVGDMPFGSYERSDEQAIENALSCFAPEVTSVRLDTATAAPEPR